jgi:hypothetical protein
MRSRVPDFERTLSTGEQSPGVDLPGVALRAKTIDDVSQEVRA